MSNVQIPNMTPAISLNGSEQMEAVQAGSTVRVTVDQIATYTDGAHGLTFIAPLSETGDVVALSTVPVDHGGTGAATLALNNVLLGNGTSAVQVVAPGGVGNVLTSDGTTWSSAAPVPDGVSTFSADTTGLTPATPTSGVVVLGGTLVVDNGGTGAATLALNNVLLGNGTSPVQEIAPGPSGNILTSDGTTWSSEAPVPDGVSTFSADTTGLTPATPTSGAVVLGGTLVVDNGGTGAATLALNNVLLGNGTDPLQEIAPGPSGNVLTSDGTTWSSEAPVPDGVSTFSADTTGLTPATPTSGAVVLGGTLVVANGGTGAATLALNNVVLGNGTSAVQLVAPSSSGNVLTSDGTTWASTALSSGAVTTFTADTTGLTPATPTSGAVVLGGTLIGANGGTGVANTGKTITLGGSLTTSGAYDSTLTATAATSVTLPTTGTLATLAGSESLTNKKLGSLITNGPIYTSGSDGTLNSETSLGVERGGTGAATLALNNVLLGNGTSPVQEIAPGGVGNVLTSDGTTWSSAAPVPDGVSTFSADTTGLTPATPTSGAVVLGGTLVVANGGTGAATLALNNVVLGNGTSAVQLVAPSSSGNVLTSDGTTWASTALSSGAVTTFTAGTTGLTPSSPTAGAVSLSGTLVVANGGTGAATLALNNVVLGNGTSAVQVVAPGSSGNVLSSDGTTWVSTALSSGAVTTFTAGTTGLTPSSPTAGAVSLAGTLVVANGGTGAATFTDGGVLIGKGTAAFETTGVLADGTIIIGDGATNPVTLAAFSSSTGTLKVDHGGTGAATLALNNVLLGNGTSAVQVVAPGGVGNVLTSNGTTWASTAPSGSGVVDWAGGTTGLTPATATSGSVTLAGTLVVANGGTGAATLTANNVLLGNGTSAVQVVAPGSSGNVLTSDGTTWASTALSSGAVTTFTAGTTGLTPSSPTAGAVTLAGTLAVANGGTGQSSVLTQYGVIYGSSSTVQGVTAAGTTGQILVATTSAAPSWGTQSGGVTWSAISTNTNAAAGSGYMVSTGAGVVTLTLPASPSVGDYLSVCDAGGTFATNNLTVARNTQPIQGSATDLTCAINGQSFGLVYQGATNGWRITQS